ncbi:hypothetical protein BCR34DRAFT_317575 [Clohesyomyces aquaticus]|uniref:Uncharacterized protein n=1 Tax=Clohesyomyces aquaticus TaxID=1231657 RepID=A0A1Y1ZMX4_9PLEO|nr:hypothetical protein BCR34DRAFT_317575 [Clohesyomyces aquaticus]
MRRCGGWSRTVISNGRTGRPGVNSCRWLLQRCPARQSPSQRVFVVHPMPKHGTRGHSPLPDQSCCRWLAGCPCCRVVLRDGVVLSGLGTQFLGLKERASRRSYKCRCRSISGGGTEKRKRGSVGSEGSWVQQSML